MILILDAKYRVLIPTLAQIRLDLASEGLDSGTEGIDDLDYILAKNRASNNKKKGAQKEKTKKPS